MFKKILKISAIILMVLILLAFTLPIIFKGKILNLAREQANKQVNARVEFSDVDISLFRHFPRLAVGLDQLQIIGTDEFNKDTLISARQIDIALNLLSLFGGDEINIYSITIDQPRIHAIVNKEGKANWDISKSDTTKTSPGSTSSFHMHLQSYQIKDAYLSYVDIQGDRSSEIEHLNHTGSGDFTSELFTLKTRTQAASVSFIYKKIPYLVNAMVSISADIDVDNKTSTYHFKTADVHVNDLQLSTEGFFRFVNNSTYGMDIQFKAPSTDFKTILSLVPSIYKNDFNKIKTSGKAVFNGFVKGEYNSTHIPAYFVNLSVENGFFQYPDLPQPVKNIDIDLRVENPDGQPDHMVLNISKGHVEFGNDPFDFRLVFKNPMTDQWMDAMLKGKLNLAEITRFVKLKSGTSLSGILEADANAKGNLATITKHQPGPFTANGFIHLTQLNYNSPDFPQPVKNGNIQIAFQNPDGIADHTFIQIPVAHIEIGSDPVDFNLSIKTPVSNLVFEGRVKGHFNLGNAKQFTTLTPGTHISGTIAGDISFAGTKEAVDKKAYDKINLSGNLDMTNIQYTSKDYPDGFLLNEASFSFNPKNITLRQARAEYLKSHLDATGSLDNMIGFMLKDEPLSGVLNLHANQIDLNKFMSASSPDTTKMSSTNQPFLVPKNISFLMNAKVDRMHYDKVDYSNLSGSIAISDETVAMKNVQMEALDGKMTASGFYSTKKDKKNPDISFTYDVSGLNIQKTFYAFNTVQKIMPAGQYVDGRMNSQFTMNGKLNGSMPDMNTLTGKGNLFMIEGVFKKFAPVEKLASSLHLDQLNGISLKDVKLSFEFANGKVLVQPFHVRVSEIDMQIGGMHGFDQSIDYVIAMKVPRSMLGGDANALVNNLAQQAVSKGFPVKISDYINFKINMGGTMTNPQIKTGLFTAGTDLSNEVKQQADAFAKQATDSVKKIANAKSNEARDSAVAIKNQAIQDLQKDMAKVITGQKDSTGHGGNVLENTQKNAEKTIKNTFENLFNKKKLAPDSTKSK